MADDIPSPDVFDQLHAAKWRDVEFPVTRSRMAIAHDLAEHKFWGVDGARVESTGLAPMRFTFSAPLLNGITPGHNETWAALYPNQLRALIAAFRLKSVGVLQHLEFGNIKCKAERLDIDWDATRRGGVDAEMSFVETKVDSDDILSHATKVKEVYVDLDLDKPTFKADLKKLLEAQGVPLPAYLTDPKVSLTDFANDIKAITDMPGVLSYRAFGKVNSLVYHADRIIDSAKGAKSALTWPAVASAERIKATAHELRQNILAKSKRIGFFTVPAATTLAGVARQIPEAKVGDLIKLNPSLMRAPEIEAGTIVRYYRA